MAESTTHQATRGRVFLIGVFITAAVVRLWGLGSPPLTIWDEKYYAFDAYSYLLGTPDLSPAGAPRVKIANERTPEHPPLGKELIGLGMGPLGFTQVGMRIAPAVFGTVAVGAVMLLALELFGSVGWAGLAGILTALDGMEVVHSRVAMLDIFLTTFITVAVLCALQARRRTGIDVWRWRTATGLMLGAALASKWTAAFVVVPVAGTVAQTGRSALARRVLAAGSVIGVAAAMYLASYSIFVADNGLAVRDFVHLQTRMLYNQRTNRNASPAASGAPSWPLLLKPIRYQPDAALARGSREVLALGNPALWWGFLALVPLQIWTLLKRRRWQDAVGIGGYLCLWAPWLFFGRTKYIYYMVPVVPFMALSCVSAIRGLPDAWAKRVGIGFGVACTAVGLAFLPVWIDLPLPGYTHYLRWLPTWI